MDLWMRTGCYESVFDQPNGVTLTLGHEDKDQEMRLQALGEYSIQV